MSIKFIELAGGLSYSSLFCAGLFRATLQTFNNLVGGERGTAVEGWGFVLFVLLGFFSQE